MTDWYNEQIDPAGYGYGGYGAHPYGGTLIEWANVASQSTTWANETISGQATWNNAPTSGQPTWSNESISGQATWSNVL
jgi:hypothetical protein